MTHPRIPKTVWALGFVSLFMDVSSEMIHSLLPVYLVGGLGISVLALGIIEGIAEATALIVKVFSGALSDFWGKRKALLLCGYGLAAFTKPIFPLAESATAVFGARFVDRIGKGIRGAPRDALVAEVSPPEIRGASFGLRQSMDTIGAFVGPLLAIGLMFLYQSDIPMVLWAAVLPAFIAMAVLIFGVKEEKSTAPKSPTFPLSKAAIAQFNAAYWWVLVLGALFTLARFSEAFLVLRASDMAVPLPLIPLVLVVMSLFYSLSAYPAGWLSDKLPRALLLAVAFCLLILADICLALAASPLLFFFGLVLWGLHLGFSQGILAAMVADTAPGSLRGTAFGLFNLVSGVAMLAASVLAGFLWQGIGPSATFAAGGVFTACALTLLLVRYKNFTQANPV